MGMEGGNRYAHGSVCGKNKASTLHASGTCSGEMYMGSHAGSDVVNRSMSVAPRGATHEGLEVTESTWH